MKLTVGYLKQILPYLDDDVIIADLNYGNRNFKPHSGVKRLLLLKDESENKGWGGETFLAINGMGSHFTGEDEQKGLVFKDHFDEDKMTPNIDGNISLNNRMRELAILILEKKWKEVTNLPFEETEKNHLRYAIDAMIEFKNT